MQPIHSPWQSVRAYSAKEPCEVPLFFRGEAVNGVRLIDLSRPQHGAGELGEIGTAREVLGLQAKSAVPGIADAALAAEGALSLST